MPANRLYASLVCPHCGTENVQEIEVELDHRGLRRSYRLGDRIDWLPGQRPDAAPGVATGYVVCTVCGRDFFVEVRIVDDIIDSVAVDTKRPGYIPP